MTLADDTKRRWLQDAGIPGPGEDEDAVTHIPDSDDAQPGGVVERWTAKRSGWTEADIRVEVAAWRRTLDHLYGNWPMLTPSQLDWLLRTIEELLDEDQEPQS